jgi:hypothetical protein
MKPGAWVQSLIPVIPATWEVEIRKTGFQGQPRQKISETPSQKNWVKGFMSIIPAKWEVWVRESQPRPALGKKHKTLT